MRLIGLNIDNTSLKQAGGSGKGMHQALKKKGSTIECMHLGTN